MAKITVTAVERQVAKARRRLNAQQLLNALAWCCAVALILSAVWFLAQPWLFGKEIESWVRWTVAGGLVALGTCAAIAAAWRRAPSRVDAALAIDQRFELKERTTSALTLAPELMESQAGRALQADAETHASKLDLRQGFPVRLSRTAVLAPVSFALLVIIAIFYDPALPTSAADLARQKAAQKVVNAEDIAKKREDLQKSAALTKVNQKKDGNLDKIEKLHEKLFQKPLDPSDKDQLREQVQVMVSLDDALKARQDELKAELDRHKALQDKLKELAKDPSAKPPREGPAKGLQDALQKGDLARAQQEMEALAEKLKKENLSDEQRKQLQEQLQDLKQDFDRLADLKELEDQLAKELADGKISDAEFARKLELAREQAEKLKDFQQLSKLLGECQMCLGEGDAKDAAMKMAALAKAMKGLDAGGMDLRQLQEERERLRAAMLAMQQGLGQGPLPGGERTSAKDADTAAKDARQQGQLDSKSAQFQFPGQQSAGTFNKIPANQLGKAFDKAQQDAPEAIERQQVPRDAAAMIRNFYENLAGAQKK